MHRILLVSDNPEHQALLEAVIDGNNCTVVATVLSGANLLGESEKLSIDLLVMMLKTDGSEQLENIRNLLSSRPMPIVMFVDKGDKDSAAKATAAGLSAYVVDGLKAERITPILAAAVTRAQKMQALSTELAQTKSKLEERKIIEKAKGLLMQQRECTETEAYNALRHLAMERNKRLGEVAQGVIDSFELLSI